MEIFRVGVAADIIDGNEKSSMISSVGPPPLVQWQFNGCSSIDSIDAMDSLNAFDA